MHEFGVTVLLFSQIHVLLTRNGHKRKLLFAEVIWNSSLSYKYLVFSKKICGSEIYALPITSMYHTHTHTLWSNSKTNLPVCNNRHVIKLGSPCLFSLWDLGYHTDRTKLIRERFFREYIIYILWSLILLLVFGTYIFKWYNVIIAIYSTSCG